MGNKKIVGLYTVSILDNVLDEKYWNVVINVAKHKTMHIYRGSAIESDDNCGTCDGARCNECKTIYEDNLECSIVCTDLEDIIRKSDPGIPEKIIKELVYSDSGNYFEGYHLQFPSGALLKEKHKDFYDKINTRDKDIHEYLKSIFNDKIRLGTLVMLCGEKFPDIDKHHLNNQVKLFWLDNKC